MKLQNILKKYRDDHGLSQRQLANQCGLSNGYISILEKGKNPNTGKPVTPTLPQLKKLASGMSMTIHELLTLADDMPISLELDPISKQPTPLADRLYNEVNAMETINDRFRKVLKDSGLSQEKFAERITRGRGEIANIVYDKTVLKDDILRAVCKEFSINEEWLRTGQGEMRVELNERQKISHFLGDVLSTAPDERSAFISALADLPPEFWPLVADLARNIADKLKKKEG